MHTFNPRVLRNLIRSSESYITEDSLILDTWTSYTGVHETAGNVVLSGEPPVTMRLGDRWRVGYDDTRYFETKVTVPGSFAGKKVYLTVDFGGESLVRINGKIVGAVNSRASDGWVHRTEILFDRPLTEGEEMNIQVEGTVDTGSFCDIAMAGGKYMDYMLSSARIDIINEGAESLYFDVKNAFEVYENCEDNYVKQRLFNAIDDAMHTLDFDLGKEAYYKSVSAAQRVFDEKLSAIEYKTPGKVMMCGHSHLDVAWLWTVKEINRKTARTFSNNIALMKNYPDFKFTQSQAVLYDFMKQHYPDIYEDVKKYVKSGQWEITGNAWVEADTNIASGESLIRQLLYGRKFFMKEFGVSSDIYWLPDCFGFTWALPQIIKRSGMKYFYTSKLNNNDTNEFPMSVFKWRSHSGDEVLSYMQKMSYQSDADASYIINVKRRNSQNDLVDATMGMYGYGDGGGGCTFAMAENIRSLSRLTGMPQTEMAFARDFYKEIEKNEADLPVWDGEMYYENHRGTYTSQAFMKKNNRRGEYLMRNIELLHVLGGGEYPAEEIEALWKKLLINQFHDILPGTSIHEVFENTKKEYAELFADGNKLEQTAFNVLNKKIAVNGKSIIVWNTLAWAYSGNVTLEVPSGDIAVMYGSDKMPCHVAEEKGKFILTFRADNVPATGYKIFSLVPDDNTLQPNVKAGTCFMENEKLKVTFDENGLLTSVTDKVNNRQILSGKGNLLSISHDKPVHESAWNLEADYQMKTWNLETADSIEVIEESPVRSVVRIVRSFNKSVITQDIILKAGSDTLDFETTVDWHEREKVLKAAFPVNIRSRYASYEIAHGAIERPTFANNPYEKAMFECCAHKWADLSEGGYGVSILNDCKYGYDIRNNIMRITLMRAPVCPDPTGDIGVSAFTYSLYPHADSWRNADTVHRAFELNVPLRAFYSQDGESEKTAESYVSVDCGNIITDALKAAEDGDGIIFRMYEAESRTSDVGITFKAAILNVTECNLMECDEHSVPCGNNSFRAHFKPHEVKTFRIRFA